MKLADFNRLKKLMQLATSDNDNEALGALRASNAILKAAGVDWQRVFERCVTVGVDVEAAPEEPDRAHERGALNARIKEAFDLVLAQDLRGDFASFIDSLQRQWEEKGYLTANQQAALFKSAERAR